LNAYRVVTRMERQSLIKRCEFSGISQYSTPSLGLASARYAWDTARETYLINNDELQRLLTEMLKQIVNLKHMDVVDMPSETVDERTLIRHWL